MSPETISPAAPPRSAREEELQLVVDAVPALLSYVDQDFRYRFVNQGYVDWFGKARDEMEGRRVQEIIHPQTWARSRAGMESALNGQRATFEGMIPDRLGHPRYVRAHFLPHRKADGAIQGIAIMVLDLTERRRTEEALLQKDRFLESIYNGAEEAIFVLDRGDDGRFRYSGFNPAYLRRAGGFGFDVREVIGQTTDALRAYFPGAVVDTVEAKYRECAESDAPIEFEDTVVLQGQTTHWLTHMSALRDEHGKAYRLIGTSLNVTRQHDDAERLQETEGQLRQSQKMEAVGRLAGGIAHDFNNLLTAINGFSELAMALIPEESAAQDMLAEIKRAGERAARLTGQLLAFSRKQMLTPRILDLNGVVVGMDALLRRVIGEDVELQAILAAELPPVLIDPGQLEQIILNLAVNSRDAMPAGGSLILETFAMDVEGPVEGTRLEAQPGPYVVLSISDTGSGMSREVRERLFEPFFTTKPPGQGTGMGLATVYGIVKQSGGHIHVYSEPGQGTSFKIFLPAMEGEAPQERAFVEPGTVARGNGETVLVVEDERVVREYIRRVLSGLGYRVLEASGGGEALETARTAPHPIGLLLTDMVMPGMGGRELWEGMRAAQPDLPVMFMSGYTEAVLARHEDFRADLPFLPKPFSPSQLAAKVGQILAASAPARP